ncbi:hypothetical protein ACLB2K_075676 [Fragaria x ananassa]
MDLQGLSVICNGLGIALDDDDGNRIGYRKHKYCLDNLKDLLRFLRRDDPQNQDVFKEVCKWNILSKDLIPIIEHCQEDLKVLVFLTMPVEPTSNDVLQQTEYLWELKSSITSSDIVAVIVSLLESLENLESDVFTEDDWKLVQLVLTLFRNILAIQDISLHQKSGGTASQFLSRRDSFLELLFRENVMDLVLVITQHIGDHRSYLSHDNLLLLEIFHYTFMGQDPELIANAYSKGKGAKVEEDTIDSVNSLNSITEEEKDKKRLKVSRHPNFGGTFIRLTMDGSKEVVKGRPSASCNTMQKPQNHRGPIKTIAWDHGILPSTEDKILELLHDFVNQFLSGGYNVLMQSIRQAIEKEHHSIQKSDVIIFFQVAQFVTSFQYHRHSSSKLSLRAEADTIEVLSSKEADRTLFRGDICGPIATSMNESMFQLVISKWRYAFDGLKETHDYKFLSAAGSLMKEMIRMLDLVLKVSKKSRKGRKRRKVSEKETENKLSGEHDMVQKEADISKDEQSTDMHVIEKRSLDTSFDGKQDISIPGQPDEGKKALLETENFPGSQAQLDHKNSGDVNDDLGYSTGDSSGDEQVPATAEVDFKVSTLVSAFSNHSIIQKLCWLLKFYKSNLTRTNHYIICMLRRISEDLELSPMLYQLSLLTIFYDILAEQKSSACNEYENIVGFLKSLVRKMLKKMKQQPLLFVEILFWKTRKECHYINAEYLLHELGQMRNESRNWGDTLEDGETGRSTDKGWTGRSLADALGEDEADVVLDFGHDNNEENLGNVEGDAASTSDNEIDGKKDHDNGVQPMKTETGRGPLKKKRLVIGEELEMKIKDLYEKFKDNHNCSQLIAEVLDPDGKILSTQISNKLKHLGLKVARRKRLRHAQESVSAEPSQPDGDNELKETAISHHESKSRPLHTRKRVRGLSEGQEAQIRSLYDQFKDHKTCSHMIANAMDGDDKLTAPQVSHKLKQLGLYIPQKKRSGANRRMRDQELNDSNTNDANASDDETLLSLMNRGKKGNIRFNEVPEQTARREVSEDESDDEMLSSVLKKARGSLSNLKDQNRPATSIQGTARGNALENEVEEAVVSSGRDVNKQSSGLGLAKSDDGDTFNQVSSHGTAQAEVISTGSGAL